MIARLVAFLIRPDRSSRCDSLTGPSASAPSALMLSVRGALWLGAMTMVVALAACGGSDADDSAKQSPVPLATATSAESPPTPGPASPTAAVGASPTVNAPRECAAATASSFGLAFQPRFCAAWDPSRWIDAKSYRLILRLDSQTLAGNRVELVYILAAGVSEFVFPAEAQLSDVGEACLKRDLYTVELRVLLPSGEIHGGAQSGTRHCNVR